MTICYIYHDVPKSGAWNMATDEFLLLRAIAYGETSLRFYGWIQPTLSLGYFQSVEDRHQHPSSAKCDLVRRASGGGAILHDLELTYSLAMPATKNSTGAAMDCYELLHESLIATLDKWKIQARKAVAIDVDQYGSRAFLCFQRRSIGDVLIGDAKIAGSAQRRYKSGLLQHGSVLLCRSNCGPELPGIQELCGVPILESQLAGAWAEEIQTRTSWALVPGDMNRDTQQRIEEFAVKKFSTAKWNFRR